MKKDIPFDSKEKRQGAFDISKEKLCEEPFLQRPHFS